MLLVVYLASIPSCWVLLLINLNASITTFPFTDWIGSMTTATKRGCSISKFYQVSKERNNEINSRYLNRTSWQSENLLAVFIKMCIIYHLCVHVDTGKPRTESWMRVIPANNHFVSFCLLEHFKHLCLEDWVECFDGFLWIKVISLWETEQHWKEEGCTPVPDWGIANTSTTFTV